MPELKDRSRKLLEKLGEAGKEAGQLLTEATKAGAGTLKTTAEGATVLTGEAVKKGLALYSGFKKEDKEVELLEKEQKTLASLSPEEQDQYLRALLAFLVPFEASDLKRLRRVYQILAVMGLPAARRQPFLDALFSAAEPIEAPDLAHQDELVRFSLAKDLLSLGGSPGSTDTQARIGGFLERINLSPEQVDALSGFTNWENQMLNKVGRADLTVSKEDLPVEAMKKAGAVGIPLAALYFSGSMVGFSAVGLSSGLATIGGAAGLAALGLNPMTAGIAALILGGVAVKKVMDATLPTTEAERKTKLQAGLRVMEARRHRYLAMLSRDLVRSLRGVSGRIAGEENRSRGRSARALSDLLDVEARATLGEAALQASSDEASSEEASSPQ